MDRKTANYRELEGVEESSFCMDYFNEDDYKGYACLLSFDKVKEKMTAETENGIVTFLDTGYKWLEFYPEVDKEISLIATYDDKDHIFEYYFDIAKTNDVDEEGIPYIDDMYLDVIMNDEGKIIVVDEDELIEAYESKEITKEEFENAYVVKDRIISLIDGKLEELTKFCDKYLKKLSK